ncbi:MAG: DinB family protein [Flavobacteriales bacterium]
MIEKPTSPSVLDKYIERVEEGDLLQAFKSQTEGMLGFMSRIPDDIWHSRYEEGKWTLAQVILHVIDCERIFSTRALCIARGETQQLPGFDENTYAEESDEQFRTKQNIIEEYIVVRTASVALFSHIKSNRLDRIGYANGNSMTPREIGFFLLGHEKHHQEVIARRYLYRG